MLLYGVKGSKGRGWRKYRDERILRGRRGKMKLHYRLKRPRQRGLATRWV